MPRPRNHPNYKERLLAVSEPEYHALLRLKADLEEEAVETMYLRDTYAAAIAIALLARGVPIPEGALDDLPDHVADSIRDELRRQRENDERLNEEEHRA